MKHTVFKIIKRTGITILSLVVLLLVVTFFYMKQAKFGKKPSGQRLSLLQGSPNYKNGRFQNVHPTPQIAEGYSMLGLPMIIFLKKGKDVGLLT